MAGALRLMILEKLAVSETNKDEFNPLLAAEARFIRAAETPQLLDEEVTAAAALRPLMRDDGTYPRSTGQT